MTSCSTTGPPTRAGPRGATATPVLPWHDLYQPWVGTCWRIERHNQAALSQALDRHRPDVAVVWHLGAMSLNLLTTLHERAVPLLYVIADDWLCYGTTLDPWSRRFNGRRHSRLGAMVRPLARVEA